MQFSMSPSSVEEPESLESLHSMLDELERKVTFFDEPKNDAELLSPSRISFRATYADTESQLHCIGAAATSLLAM